MTSYVESEKLELYKDATLLTLDYLESQTLQGATRPHTYNTPFDWKSVPVNVKEIALFKGERPKRSVNEGKS